MSHIGNIRNIDNIGTDIIQAISYWIHQNITHDTYHLYRPIFRTLYLTFALILALLLWHGYILHEILLILAIFFITFFFVSSYIAWRINDFPSLYNQFIACDSEASKLEPKIKTPPFDLFFFFFNLIWH